MCVDWKKIDLGSINKKTFAMLGGGGVVKRGWGFEWIHYKKYLQKLEIQCKKGFVFFI